MIIDSHTHYFKSFSTMRGIKSPEEFLDKMKSSGIDKAVVFTVDGFYSDYKKANDELAELAGKFPGTLCAFCTVNPRDGEEAVKEVQRCVQELGMGGIKFHNWLQAVSAVDPCMLPIVEEAARLKIPVVFHDGTPPYCTSLQVAYLAKSYPEATIILGHSGLNDFWREAARAALKYDNIVLGVCGPPMEAIKKMVEVIGADRLVWGSDFPFGGSQENPEGAVAYHRNKVEYLEISEEEKEKIFRGNILRLVPALR